jgi:alpha,alpha-trehalase
VLNRYFDDIPEPRPESYREDYALVQTVPISQRVALYRNLRASAESGWDFSSRWMRDPTNLRTLETIELLPVDLNSLLFHAEQTIAALRRLRGRAGDAEVAARFTDAAAKRRRALLAAAYDPEHGFFYDVRWRTGERVTDRPTLAAAAPLYFGLATLAQGRAVAARLERDFLKPGGMVTTLIASGQQWDAPNGWPPLQWLSIEGVRRYGRGDVADRARGRWLALNRRTYRSTGKMTEKYDVVDLNRRAGGGEYPTQDGFGWSNGVALALAAQERDARARSPSRSRRSRRAIPRYGRTRIAGVSPNLSGKYLTKDALSAGGKSWKASTKWSVRVEPKRRAPARRYSKTSGSSRIPPAAFTWHRPFTAWYIRRTSSSVAPPSA